MLVLLILFPLILLGQQRHVSIDSARIYLNLAQELSVNNTTKALEYIQKTERLIASDDYTTTDKYLEADLLITKSRVYYVNGDYTFVYENMLKAYNLSSSINYYSGMAKSLNGQGIVLQAIENHEEAIADFKKSIEYFNKEVFDPYILAVYVNIAISLIEHKKYEEARNYLAMVIDADYERTNNYYQHLALNKLGYIYKKEKKYQLALEYFSKVLTDKIEPNIWEKAYANNEIASCYLALGKIDVALGYAKKGLQYAKAVGAKWDMERSYYVMYKVYSKLNNTKEALSYYELSAAYKDSLFSQIRLHQIDLMKLRKDEKERSILIAENEMKDAKIKRDNILLISIVGIAVFLLLLLLQHRKRIKREARLYEEIKLQSAEVEAQNETIQNHNKILVKHNQAKDRLISVFSHDLRSPISSMEQLLELMVQGHFSEEEVKDLMEELLIQVRSTSFMLNDLLKWAKLQLDGLEVNPVKVDLIEKVKRTLNSFYLNIKRKNILIENNRKGNNVLLIYADDAHVNIILHNMLANAIKYTDVKKSIKITYETAETGTTLSIFNEGVVISDTRIAEILNTNKALNSEKGTSLERGEGIGLLLIKRFVTINDCTLDIKAHPSKGTEFLVTFPKFKS
ncbi:hypothetical protein NBRC110019_11950 [Neptunitalea chrysea]|uniref:histidine kinase n=2 Tax=Neptunitalea chrysea TaxID=1647581 RepID=A0A9W6B3T2_9FLAO|nr:hypothetical protein NBRC110019_11950 [Neptunitalea chrysea]